MLESDRTLTLRQAQGRQLNDRHSLKQIIILNSVSGGVGGAAFYFNSQAASPFLVSIFLGAIAGVIGASFVADKITIILPKSDRTRNEIVASLISGFAAKPLLAAIISVATLQAEVHQLKVENSQAQGDLIEKVNEIAFADSTAEQKTIAIETATNIARDSDDLEIQQKAIAAVDAIAKESNPEIQLETIEQLKQLATITQDARIKEDILGDLNTYIDDDRPTVSTAAKQALKELEN